MDLYFRDGRLFTGDRGTLRFSVEKGDGKVYTFRPCAECGGLAGPLNWPNVCGKCRGLGKTTQKSWQHVYTAERLAKINLAADLKKRHAATASLLLVRETKRSYFQFCRSRDRLITEIGEYAPLSERLQEFDRRINEGTVLTPAEIREALTLTQKYRSK